MGGVGQVGCQDFLVREACVGVLVGEMDLFSLECNELSSSEFWGVHGFGMTLGNLSFNVHVCVPVLLEN